MDFLQYTEPGLRDYILRNSLPEIYEALLIGLLIECPKDPLLFLEEKIKELLRRKGSKATLRLKGRNLLSWDMFVSDKYKKDLKHLVGSYLKQLFDPDPEPEEPPPIENLEKAYLLYTNLLKRKCFWAWMAYRKEVQRNKAANERNEAKAVKHYSQRKLNLAFNNWRQWVKFCKDRQALAVKKIEHVYDQVLLKNIFEAWVGAVKEAKRTREYFARLEQGDLDDDSDTQLFGQGEAKDDISNLPWQAAIRIFMFLGIIDLAHCSQVCQSWKVITQTSVLWNKMDFYPIKDWIIDNGVTYLLRQYRPYAIHLSLRSCTHLGWPSFKSVSECRNLQDLNLSGCTGLTDEYLSAILESCSSILFLNLSYTTISDVSMRILSKCCLNLQYLSVAFCRRFSDKGLNYLASGNGCHKLIYLDLSGCTQISVKGFKALSIACNEVQHLIINDMATLTDSCIVALVAHYYKLSMISLLGSPHLYDIAIKALVQGKKLTKIKIDGNKHITDSCLKIIGKYCPQMRYLSLTDCPRITDIGLKFLETLKGIIVLNLADSVRITDAGLKSFADGSSGPKVRELNLTNCVNISDFLLMKLVQRCTNLTHLKLCYCDHLTDNGIELLGSLPNLTSIDLTGTQTQDQGTAALSTNIKCTQLVISDCHGITDIGLQKFCHRSINLDYLDVSHCIALSNQSIKTLSFCCRSLTYLDLSKCPKITDLSLQYLIGGCHYLRYLDISGCVRVTDVIFKLLKKGFRKLRFLKMLYCAKITKSAFDKEMRANIQCEFNNEPPPKWYGYDSLGNIIKREERNQEDEEEDKGTDEDEELNQDVDEDQFNIQIEDPSDEENQANNPQPK